MRNARLIITVAVAAVLAAGCGGGGPGKFHSSEAGLTMDLPPGWSQGAPKMAGGFFRNSSGKYFYESPARDFPHGNVMVFPLEGASLAEHVEKVIEQDKAMTGMFQALVEVAGNVAGPGTQREVKEAQESLETDISEPEELTLGEQTGYAVTFKKPDLSTCRVFVQRGDEVIEVVFQAETPDWPKYEPVFKAAAATIQVD